MPEKWQVHSRDILTGYSTGLHNVHEVIMCGCASLSSAMYFAHALTNRIVYPV
jgi:phosphoheptose isomerase